MDEEQQVAAETESVRSKKKMFIIIGVAVAVAVILGVVAFMLMSKDNKKEHGKGDAKVESKAERDEHGGVAASGASSIYSLEPFIVNIYEGQELHSLKVKVEIEMAGAAKSELDARLAPIRDAVLMLLSTKTMQDIKDVQGKDKIKEEILVAINKIISPSKIAKVYFTEFIVL